MIKLTQHGSFKHTFDFFNGAKTLDKRILQIMERYGRQGVSALQKATPHDTGRTSDSWSYSVESDGLYFYNSNWNQGVSVAILLQYGHATGTGGYVQGRDYINPALQPIFDQIFQEIDKEVRRL
ncbi:MAG: HK97 gp10 family phage protein [Brevinema sp.]